MSIINGKEFSNDLLEYSDGRGNPNIRVISESGLYRILAKYNLANQMLKHLSVGSYLTP